MRLCKRRAELSGEIKNTHNNLKRMIQELEHLDKTLLMFDPNHQIEQIKPKAFRPPDNWSQRGQMTRVILGILRKAAEPMTTRDVAMQMLIERGLDSDDVKLLRVFRGRVRAPCASSATKAWCAVSRGQGSTCCGTC